MALLLHDRCVNTIDRVYASLFAVLLGVWVYAFEKSHGNGIVVATLYCLLFFVLDWLWVIIYFEKSEQRQGLLLTNIVYMIVQIIALATFIVLFLKDINDHDFPIRSSYFWFLILLYSSVGWSKRNPKPNQELFTIGNILFLVFYAFFFTMWLLLPYYSRYFVDILWFYLLVRFVVNVWFLRIEFAKAGV